MEEYPTTLGEFEERFGSDEACRDYLFRLRFKNGFACPKCGGKKAWFIKGTLYECNACGHQTSITAGTLFHNTHKPLLMWFRAIWWITQQKTGTSTQDLQRILGLGSYRTAWTWMQKLRRAMVRPNREKISGHIEIDTVFIEGTADRKRGKKRSKAKVLVVIAVETSAKNRIGRIRMRALKDKSVPNLLLFIEETIEKGAILVTSAVSNISIDNTKYTHIISEQQSPGQADKPLPHVQLVVSQFKRWVLGTLQGSLSAKYMGYYIDEFVFRFNKRKYSRGLPFYRILEHAMMLDSLTYDKILSKTAFPV